MNYPSVKTLLCISGLTSQEAKRIRRVMRSQDRDEICSLSPKADKWRRQCCNEPLLSELKMCAIDDITGTYGVEYTRKGSNSKSPAFAYCNTGDSYAATVLLINGRFSVGSWGDIVERGSYE
jgi:hypothetical protein